MTYSQFIWIAIIIGTGLYSIVEIENMSHGVKRDSAICGDDQ